MPLKTATPRLQDHLEASAARAPDKVALVAGARRLTYAEIDAGANALARGLARLGVRRGDRVLVFADNTVETVLSFWGTLKAGAVACIVSPLTKAGKLAYLLQDSGARALITDAHLTPVFAEAARQAPLLGAIVVSGAIDAARTAGLPVTSFDAALDASTERGPPPRVGLDIDLAAIIYTSGSTGLPKGVMLTHRNMLAASASITSYLGMGEDDVVLGVLPLSFDYGLYQLIMSFEVGARLILERSFAYPAAVLETVVRERVTGFPGVPTMFAMLADLTGPSYDFGAIRFVTNTAAALPVKHITMLRTLFPQARIYSMYGLTECKRCTYLPPEDLERKPESVGIAIPNTELWLVDEADRKLGPNVTGQLVIRGATVMRGYWNKPEETAQKLRPGPLPGESVLYTGDLCRLDDEGYLYFVARMDDLIKSRGEKVAPKEVEAALVAISGIREAAVIGVADALLGQAVKAFVVLERGATLTPKEIALACAARLEAFMVPKLVEIVLTLPKTESGKVKKAELA